MINCLLSLLFAILSMCLCRCCHETACTTSSAGSAPTCRSVNAPPARPICFLPWCVRVSEFFAFVFPGWREESELKAVHGRADLIPGQWNNPILPTIAKCFASKLQNVVKAEVWLQPSGVRPDPSIILLQPQPCRKTSSESARCYQRPLWSHLVFVCSATARLCVQE